MIHVLENPPENWDGYKGFVTEEILKNHLPDKVIKTDYYVCGPEPMMDAVESTLRKWQIPVYKLHSERFNIV